MKMEAKQEQLNHIARKYCFSLRDLEHDGLYYDGFFTFDQMAEIVDYLRTPEDNKNELFEKCWVDYRRKGSKKKAREYWLKLSDKEKDMVRPHIKAYVSANELQYQKDFERYLRDKTFLNVVYANNVVTYDPSRVFADESTIAAYMPETGTCIFWKEALSCYIYVGYWDGKNIADGYNDSNRPNGATITLNNGRGRIQWDAKSKEWRKII